jgi:alpha-galactosidase
MGFDFLKYDWCSYSTIVQSGTPQQPVYALMGHLLTSQNRDIVYSLCQYGYGVWTWGASAGGNLWRTSWDDTDSWTTMAGIGFGLGQLAPYVKPGNWNDPDNLLIGWLHVTGASWPTRLLPGEQYVQMTLWSLASAPLLMGGDLTKLDAFTTSLLTNDEVLEVDQDPAGAQATPVVINGNTQVWSKKLSDGSIAAGLFNLGVQSAMVTVPWSALGISGPYVARDLWRQMDLGTSSASFQASVAAHGVVMLRFYPAGKTTR